MFKMWGTFVLTLVIGSSACAQDVPMAAWRAQMDIERGKEQELQLLQLDVERLKLEVEKKKAVVELGKINAARGDGDPSDASDGRPSVVLRYVFMSLGRKEAVFDLDGLERRVQEGGEVGGQVVKSISADGVSLKAKDGSESFLKPGA
jgi:hypothetical protein